MCLKTYVVHGCIRQPRSWRAVPAGTHLEGLSNFPTMYHHCPKETVMRGKPSCCRQCRRHSPWHRLVSPNLFQIEFFCLWGFWVFSEFFFNLNLQLVPLTNWFWNYILLCKYSEANDTLAKNDDDQVFLAKRAQWRRRKEPPVVPTKTKLYDSSDL